MEKKKKSRGEEGREFIILHCGFSTHHTILADFKKKTKQQANLKSINPNEIENKHTILQNLNFLLISDYCTNKYHEIFTHAEMPEQVPAGLNPFRHKGRLFYTLLTGAFLSIGFMTNFLSLKEMFLISLQGKPILGVSLQREKVLIRSSKVVRFIYIPEVLTLYYFQYHT